MPKMSLEMSLSEPSEELGTNQGRLISRWVMWPQELTSCGEPLWHNIGLASKWSGRSGCYKGGGCDAYLLQKIYFQTIIIKVLVFLNFQYKYASNKSSTSNKCLLKVLDFNSLLFVIFECSKYILNIYFLYSWDLLAHGYISISRSNEN